MPYKGKESLIQLAGLLAAKGVETAVISPGSRNAPVIAALNRQEGIRCLSIVDERSAAFFALGIAQQTQKPVAIACTSGTASLNYAPAIAEAYYQQVPLIVLTADRPAEWIDQGDGQTLRQHGLYANYIRKSVQLPAEPWNENTLRYNTRLINEAIDASTYPDYGPVHINIPLSEPLYKETEKQLPPVNAVELIKVKHALDEKTLLNLVGKWNKAKSKLVVTGLLFPDPVINSLLQSLSDDPTVAIFTETTSNLKGRNFFPHIDRLIDGIENEINDRFVPEILLTLGGNIVSRKLKAWLQTHKPKEHWHVASAEFHTDTFRSLTLTIPAKASDFLEDFVPLTKASPGNYLADWAERQSSRTVKHNEFIRAGEWSDLKAFDCILKNIAPGTMLQAGNSTPIRYLQLFDMPSQTTCFGNRGVSGIDGCMSTAAGAAWAVKTPTVFIGGDVTFMYDSNALWNQHFPSNLRIIVMNNGGGNIFRIIEGPDTMPELDTFIETPFIPEIEHLVKMFGLDFYSVSSEDDLLDTLPIFLDQNTGKSAVLEVKTPNKTSASVLREYFKYLRS